MHTRGNEVEREGMRARKRGRVRRGVLCLAGITVVLCLTRLQDGLGSAKKGSKLDHATLLKASNHLDNRRGLQGSVNDTETLVTGAPTASPTVRSQNVDTSVPTLPAAPSARPSIMPSQLPSTPAPSMTPSQLPSPSPSESIAPSDNPTISPAPTGSPSQAPTDSKSPSDFPSSVPSVSLVPTTSLQPSNSPSQEPSMEPSVSAEPSKVPTEAPSDVPSTMPSISPSDAPSTSLEPSASPSKSSMPSKVPSAFPSVFPSVIPSSFPSILPSDIPTTIPSQVPSFLPTVEIKANHTQSVVLVLVGMNETRTANRFVSWLNDFVKDFWQDMYAKDPLNTPAFVSSVATSGTKWVKEGDGEHVLSYRQVIHFGYLSVPIETERLFEPLDQTLFLLPFQQNAGAFGETVMESLPNPFPVFVKSFRVGEPSESETVSSSNRRDRSLIALIVLVVVFIVIAVGILLYCKLQRDEKQLREQRIQQSLHRPTPSSMSGMSNVGRRVKYVHTYPKNSPKSGGPMSVANSSEDEISDIPIAKSPKLTNKEFLQAFDDSDDLEGLVIRQNFPSAVSSPYHRQIMEFTTPPPRTTPSGTALHTIYSQSLDDILNDEPEVAEAQQPTMVPEMSGFQMEVINLDE